MNTTYRGWVFAGICALVFLAFSFGQASGAPSLNHYVKKYQHIKATPEQQRRIARYDNLIKYFSSFAYFKPGHKVNTSFLKALMLAESNGDHKARSSKDARGLCQIIYPTALLAAKELTSNKYTFRFNYVSKKRLRNLQPDDLYNPAINILLACYLISKYNHKFGGKLDLVVAAWNAGENSITRSKPPQYRETLDLIGKVNGFFIYFLKHKKGYSRYAS